MDAQTLPQVRMPRRDDYVMPGTWTPETRRGFRIEPDRWGMVTPSATVPLAQLLPAPQDEPCRPGSVGQAFGGCFPKSLREQRRGVRVGFAEADPDLESRGADEPLDHVGGRGAGASFDTGDRRLRHAGRRPSSACVHPARLRASRTRFRRIISLFYTMQRATGGKRGAGRASTSRVGRSARRLRCTWSRVALARQPDAGRTVRRGAEQRPG